MTSTEEYRRNWLAIEFCIKHEYSGNKASNDVVFEKLAALHLDPCLSRIIGMRLLGKKEFERRSGHPEHYLPWNKKLKEIRHRVPDWCHGRDETPPAGFFGRPLTGTQKELAARICLHGDTRLLRRKAENGIIWVRRIHRTRYEVWFKSEHDFHRASFHQM